MMSSSPSSRGPAVTDTQPAPMTSGLAVLLAIASGVAVARIYYARAQLDQIGRELGVGPPDLGLVTTVTQTGYFLGLILIVPLGDVFNRRLLIVGGCVIASALSSLCSYHRVRRSSWSPAAGVGWHWWFSRSSTPTRPH
jgi:MFS family permease